MKTPQHIKDYWQSYCAKNGIATTTPYQHWHFCRTQKLALELADLVMKGIKTATCSLHMAYEWDNWPLPKVGDYSIVTDLYDKPFCIIQTSVINIIPFKEVTPEFAYKEGEGDRSYQYWHDAHVDYFNVGLNARGQSFNEDMLVVCEEFVLLDTLKS